MSTSPNGPNPPVRVGVDVGGTFTDLVAADPVTGELSVAKVPSTPPDFERGVIDALSQHAVRQGGQAIDLIHGSTVATNALLQRAGERAALIATEGFRDVLLIGRQNRPELYNLRVRRPRPVISPDDCFTVPERTGPKGEIIHALDERALEAVLDQIEVRGIRHIAVCLLFSFANPAHELAIAAACRRRGLTCSVSSGVLPEFREYERASTTAINASLRPTVERYLTSLERSLEQSAGSATRSIQIMQSSGGTLSVREASETAVRLLLSGPAGGVIGASFVAEQLGLTDIITYDMGGTSTDVATILNGRPTWTTSTMIDGLPVGVPMFDIHTVGAGGGSVAYLDEGGSLRVGPRSAGATPGPACYGRGGTEPTVTDANVLLGRIPPGQFLGGAMKLQPDLAAEAVGGLARRLAKLPEETALGILRVVESNMEHAIRAVTTRRGHDPRSFTLVSFGGAGGLHACRLADALEIPRVLVPPYCGVLSALGMAVAPAIADASKTVLQLGEDLDDSRLPAEYGYLSGLTSDHIPPEFTARVEPFADCRFAGQSHELTVPVQSPTLANIEENFLQAYTHRYGPPPPDRRLQVTTLRVRRTAHAPKVTLPRLAVANPIHGQASIIDDRGRHTTVPMFNRSALLQLATGSRELGAFLLIDPEATTYVPPDWSAAVQDTGTVVLTRMRG